MKQENTGRKGISRLVCLLLAVLVVVLLVLILRTMEKRKEAVIKVWVAATDVEAYTVIEDGEWESFFARKDIPKSMVYEGVLCDGEWTGRILVTEHLCAGEMLSEDKITAGALATDALVNPAELGIKADSFARAAGGTLRRGDAVEMCAVDGAGNERTLQTMILQAFDQSGKRIGSDDTESVAVAFTILVERDEYATVKEILDMGKDFDLIRTENIK